MKVFTLAGKEMGWAAFSHGSSSFPFREFTLLRFRIIFLSVVLATLLFTDLYKTFGEASEWGKSIIRAAFKLAHLLKKELFE